MFIKGKCAIYIDKNLRVYEKSTGIFVLWTNIKKISFLETNQKYTLNPKGEISKLDERKANESCSS